MAADMFMTIRNPVYGSGTVTAYTGTAGTRGVLPAGCSSVWVLCTTAAFVKVGIDPTATTADFPVAANVGYVLPIPANKSSQEYKVSAIQVAAGGNLHVIALAE